MTHALSGSLHTAFSHVRKNWANLLQVTALPLLIVAAFLGLYLYFFSSFFTRIFELAAGTDMNDPEIARQMVSSIFKLQAFSLAGSLVMMFVIALACVRIVRLYVLGEKPWWRFNGEVAMATLMWGLYSIGIYFISVIAMFAIMLGLGLVGGLGGALVAMASGGQPGGGIAVLGAILAILMFVLMWFLVLAVPLRLAAGMAVVALGKTPDFMNDMWKLSRGYTRALIWRGLGLYVLSGLVIVAVILLISGGTIWDMVNQISALDQSAEQDPQVVFRIVEPMLRTTLDASIAAFVVSIPFLWVAIVWLAEVNRRLLAAQKENA